MRLTTIRRIAYALFKHRGRWSDGRGSFVDVFFEFAQEFQGTVRQFMAPTIRFHVGSHGFKGSPCLIVCFGKPTAASFPFRNRERGLGSLDRPRCVEVRLGLAAWKDTRLRLRVLVEP